MYTEVTSTGFDFLTSTAQFNEIMLRGRVRVGERGMGRGRGGDRVRTRLIRPHRRVRGARSLVAWSAVGGRKDMTLLQDETTSAF